MSCLSLGELIVFSVSVFDSSCPPPPPQLLSGSAATLTLSTSLGEPEVPCAWQSLERPCRGRSPMPIPEKGSAPLWVSHP